MRSMEGAYYPRLDHIRAIAAFQVYCWHFVHFWVPSTYVPSFFLLSLLEEGHTGVALFMTLSGYLFAKISDGRVISYPRFFWNRFVRLAPLLAALFIYYAVYYGFGWIALLRGFVLPNGWPSGAWSAAVEIHFYLVFPLLLALQRRIGVAALSACLVAAIALRAVLFLRAGEVQVLAYWTLVGRFDQFLLGMIFFHVGRRAFLKCRARMILAAAILAFGVGWHLFNRAGGYAHMPSYPSPSPLWIILPTLEGLGYATIIAAYDNMPGDGRSRVGGVLARIGEVSYSIYLLHFLLILELVKPRIAPAGFGETMLCAAAIFPFVVLVATASYHLIERPFLGLRVRYVRPSRGNALFTTSR